MKVLRWVRTINSCANETKCRQRNMPNSLLDIVDRSVMLIDFWSHLGWLISELTQSLSNHLRSKSPKLRTSLVVGFLPHSVIRTSLPPANIGRDHSTNPASRNPSPYRARSSARRNGPTTSLRFETRSAGFSCRSRATAFCAAPASRPLRCLLRRYVIQVDSPDCPATPWSPTIPLRRSGPRRNVRPQSRPAFPTATDQVGSSAWHVRSARSPFPVRRTRFLPSRRNSMPRPNWN
jgi:hypothetical protein